MSEAKKGDVVKFDYTAKLTDGTVIGTSEGREPIEVTVGEGMVIPGLDTALEGMEAGASKTVEVSPEEAYGHYLDELVLQFPRELVPEHIEPHLGQQLRVQLESGRESIARVMELSDDNITLDGNHPLAGKSLVLDVHLVEIV